MRRMPAVNEMAFTMVERGTCGGESVEARVPTVRKIADDAAWRAFWRSTHPRRAQGIDSGAAWSKAPYIDFNRYMVVVVTGAPGAAEVRLLDLIRQPRQVVADVASIAWPELARGANQAPYEAVLCYRDPLPLVPREDAVTRAFNRLVLKAPNFSRLPGGGTRDLSPGSLAAVRDRFHTQGEVFLAELWRLQTSAPYGPYIPYSKLLEASILEDVVGRVDQAKGRYQELARRFSGTVFARLARHRLARIVRRDLDQVSLKELNQQRAALAARALTGGDAKRWSELGGMYEYLMSSRPEALFTAAECYLRGTADQTDPDTVRNCYLRAAALYESYLNRRMALAAYWQCVRRFPNAPCSVSVLKKMDAIGRKLSPSAAGQYYRQYLAIFPTSAQAAAVRRLLPD
ncbi:MAG: hypothetical protein FJX76_27010 [Armatimonadetes bacterium]|nr:hypothetical protein [Armatimonadota bacterium]